MIYKKYERSHTWLLIFILLGAVLCIGAAVTLYKVVPSVISLGNEERDPEPLPLSEEGSDSSEMAGNDFEQLAAITEARVSVMALESELQNGEEYNNLVENLEVIESTLAEAYVNAGPAGAQKLQEIRNTFSEAKAALHSNEQAPLVLGELSAYLESEILYE